MLFLAGWAAYAAWKEYGANVIKLIKSENPTWNFWLETLTSEGNQPQFSYESNEMYVMFPTEPIGIKSKKLLRDHFTEEMTGANGYWIYAVRN